MFLPVLVENGFLMNHGTRCISMKAHLFVMEPAHDKP